MPELKTLLDRAHTLPENPRNTGRALSGSVNVGDKKVLCGVKSRLAPEVR
jgi:hypothetical protein